MNYRIQNHAPYISKTEEAVNHTTVYGDIQAAKQAICLHFKAEREAAKLLNKLAIKAVRGLKAKDLPVFEPQSQPDMREDGLLSIPAGARGLTVVQPPGGPTANLPLTSEAPLALTPGPWMGKAKD